MAHEKEREALKEVYKHSKAWIAKVNGWTDEQVLAVYLRFKNQGVIK